MEGRIKSIQGVLAVMCFAAAVGFAQEQMDGLLREKADAVKLLPEKRAHPRLFLSEERLVEIRQQRQTDPLLADLLAEITKRADSYLDASPLRFKTSDPALMGQARGAVGRILSWSLLYRLNGDERYLNAARDLLLNVSSFPAWWNKQFLRAGEFGFAVSIGYDWLYPQLTPEERGVIRKGLVDKILSQAPDAYAVDGKGRKPAGWHAFNYESDLAFNNHNQVCNAGYLYAAVALWDEEPELAQLVIDGARKSLPLALRDYGPDGGWSEGPVYWAYGLVYGILDIALLEDVFGTSFGLAEIEGIGRTPEYAMQIFGPSGICFNYADCGRASDYQIGSGWHFTWLGRRFDQPALLDLNRRRTKEFLQNIKPPTGTLGKENRMLPLSVVWFPTAEEGAASVPPLDSRFRGDGDIAMFRSKAGDTNALWIGVKAGLNGVPHGNLDLGSFVLEADGVRWAVELGSDNYSLPGYWKDGNGEPRWNYYRLNSYSHNILSVGVRQQDATARAEIINYQSSPECAFAVMDLTTVYPGQAGRILRGVAMLDRSRLLIQDEVQDLLPGKDIHWRMLTATDVTVAENGRSALLQKGGQTLNLQIISGPSGAAFATKSPPVLSEGEKPLGPHTELEISFVPQTTDVCMVVLVTPGSLMNADLPTPDVIPLADWSAASTH